MNLETSKILGGIGAILVFIGIIPLFAYSSVISLVGAILVLVGLYGIGNYYREPGIFTNALIGILMGIIGVVVITVIAFTVLWANVTDLLVQIYPNWTPGDWTGLQGMTPDPNALNNFDFTNLLPLIWGLIGVAVIGWIVAIIASFFLWRSLKIITTKSTVGLFGTAGLLLLIGAFLAVIIIGFILMWIAALLLAIAFFQLKTQPVTVTTTPPPPPTTV